MISIEIEGLDELKKHLHEAGPLIREKIKHAMVQSINAIKNDAQDMAPYQSGTLRRSIFTDIEDEGFTGIIAQDGDIASYGLAQEYGTQGMQIHGVSKLGKTFFYLGNIPPHPYMQPSFEKNVDEIKENFEEAINEVLERIAQ